MNKIYTFNTKKTSNGFEYNAGYFTGSQDTFKVTILKTGTANTRAKAMRLAKKWKMYLKAVAA